MAQGWWRRRVDDVDMDGAHGAADQRGPAGAVRRIAWLRARAHVIALFDHVAVGTPVRIEGPGLVA